MFRVIKYRFLLRNNNKEGTFNSYMVSIFQRAKQFVLYFVSFFSDLSAAMRDVYTLQIYSSLIFLNC